MSSKMDELERRGYKGYDENGGQMVSSIPVRLPVGFVHKDNFAERVRSIVRSERLKAEAEAMGAETFEEADDFEIADDPVDPSTPYEADFDAPTPAEIKRQERERAKREDIEDNYRRARESRGLDERTKGKGKGAPVDRKVRSRDGDLADQDE